jgi:hypothetical protein
VFWLPAATETSQIIGTTKAITLPAKAVARRSMLRVRSSPMPLRISAGCGWVVVEQALDARLEVPRERQRQRQRRQVATGLDRVDGLA